MATHTKPQPAGAPTWLDLMTPDAAAARTFYGHVFGWEYDVSGPEFGYYATARLGDRMTVGVVGNQPDAPPQPPGWSLFFASHNCEGDTERATALGGSVMFPPAAVGDVGTMAVLADPTGAPFCLWQAGTHPGWQVTDEPGAVTWFELYTPDAKRARDFYTALLGTTANLVPGGLEYYSLHHGSEMLAGIMQTDPSWGAMPTQWVPYFAVANADQTLAAIVEHGGKAMSGIDDSPFGRLAACADPAGAFFKIVELPQRG